MVGGSTNFDTPPNSLSSGLQATCMDVDIDATNCEWAYVDDRLYLYCPVHAEWPRPDSTCALLQASPPPPVGRSRSSTGRRSLLIDAPTVASVAATASVVPVGVAAMPLLGRRELQAGGGGPAMDEICSGDRLAQVLPGLGSSPVPGGINEVAPWRSGNSSKYMQWIRWAEDDFAAQTVLFSVRTGDRPCTTGDSELVMSLRGMRATVSGPRFMSNGTVAGCASNNGTVFNQCLWRVVIPRPGGPGWDDAGVCVKPKPPPTPPSPPSPPVPVPSPAASPCAQTGPTTNASSTSITDCSTQASCLDLDYRSDTCTFRTIDGTRYLYCSVCLRWPRAGSGACALAAAGATIQQVCTGDENAIVVDPASGDEVFGGINSQSPWAQSESYCQWVRWEASDTSVQTIYFSIRSSEDGRCLRRSADSPLSLLVKGVDFTCGNPRLTAEGDFAGCQGGDNIDNQCLWTLAVPRPGAPGWNGDVCFVDTPAPAPLRLPPPKGPKANRVPSPPPPGPAPGQDVCTHSGRTFGTGTGGGDDSANCLTQASCLDVYYNSQTCAWRAVGGKMYLYCSVCLRWPRGDGSSCGLGRNAVMEAVCTGDESMRVLDPATGNLTDGGAFALSPFTRTDSYCQSVRWEADDFLPQTIYYSVRSSEGGRCLRRSADDAVELTIQGLDATCGNPKTTRGGAYQGCQGGDDIDNECLWSLVVPRPSGPGWNGQDCVTPLTPPPSPPPRPTPPRSPRAPGIRQPSRPPPSPRPPGREPSWPFCACQNRSPRNTPYRLRHVNSTKLQPLSDGYPRQQHCFNIDVEDCDDSNPCCNMGIKKLELWVRNECRSQVQLVLLGRQSVAWSFTQNTVDSGVYTTWKLPELDLSPQEVGRGLGMCITLKDPCASLEKFCYNGGSDICRATFFNYATSTLEDEQCCPVSDTPF